MEQIKSRLTWVKTIRHDSLLKNAGRNQKNQ